MKILYLSDDFPPKSYGGAGIIAYNDARALAQAGHDVHVVTVTDTKVEVGKKSIDGLTLHVLYSTYHPRWRHFVSVHNRNITCGVEKIIDEIKPDVVHAHNIHLHISYKTLDLAARKVKKVFLTAHDVMLVHYGKMMFGPGDSPRISSWRLLKDYGFRFNPLRNFLIKKYTARITAIFAVSETVKKVLIANGITKVEVLHNGIDVGDWVSSPEEVLEFKKKCGLVDTKVVLLSGRIGALKGGKVLVDAFEKVVKEIPSTRLLLVGTINEYLKSLLVTMPESLRQKIISTGWVSRKDMKTVYAAADIVATPSLYLDPFPTVNLEARASRKPVVGTIFGGTSEVILDAKTGYIIDPNNTDLFAKKIIELLSDSSKAAAFGNAGYERVKNEFSASEHIAKLLSWYTKP